jgi:WD40 repeat protein
VPNLRLLTSGPGSGGHGGEVFCCAFTHDDNYVLSGGWDGHLRLWESSSGIQAAAFRASHKPISACASSPDGRHLVSGCLEGFLTRWDAATHQPAAKLLAHVRPISTITYADDGKRLATASWDGSLVLWDLEHDREGQTLGSHADIVAGCRFTPGGRSLLSWSHDGTLGLWNLAPAQRPAKLSGHGDRVTAAAVSPDGTKIASGSRDRTLKLWDLQTRQNVATCSLANDVKACCFLLDGETLVAVDGHGRITLHALPGLEVRTHLATRLSVQCAALARSGSRIALGCENGQVVLVAVEGFDSAPLLVTATETSRRTATALQRLFGRHRLSQTYLCTCPVCRQSIECAASDSTRPLPCPGCQRQLRIANHFEALALKDH